MYYAVFVNALLCYIKYLDKLHNSKNFIPTTDKDMRYVLKLLMKYWYYKVIKNIFIFISII